MPPFGASCRDQGIHARGRRGRASLTTLRTLDTPYPQMVGLPQHETEALLLQRLRALGGDAQRGVQLLSFTQDDSGVTATLRVPCAAPAPALQPERLGCFGVCSKTLHADALLLQQPHILGGSAVVLRAGRL